MLIGFFYSLRQGGVPVSLSEFLTFVAALNDEEIFDSRLDTFFHIARACLVKDEQYFDRFARIFSDFVQRLANQAGELNRAEIPNEWLRPHAADHLSKEERERLESLDLPKLLEQLRDRLQRQRERHEGGSHWIGTAGSSPLGSSGYHPSGIRIGGESRYHRALKVWETREFSALDPEAALDQRNLQVALRGLRRFAREGGEQELDIAETVRSSAKNGGRLDLRWRHKRQNVERVIALFDVGGTMQTHLQISQKLLGAAKYQFRHFAAYYFHNLVYDRVWSKGYRKGDSIPTLQLLRRLGPEHKVLIIGDASMAPTEITAVNGSVDWNNPEPGEVWLRRLCKAWPNLAWLNPEPEHSWPLTQSIEMVQEIINDRMYPLTLDGINRAVRALRS